MMNNTLFSSFKWTNFVDLPALNILFKLDNTFELFNEENHTKWNLASKT